MWTVESAKVERPYPGKDHDRVFVDAECNIFAVFDGASRAEASNLAIASLQRIVKNSTRFDVQTAFGIIQTDILYEFGGDCLTTGSIVHLSSTGNDLTFNFASAGDSPIYRYGHQNQSFQRETIDESRRLATHIDADNFLGSPLHVLKQIGRSVITEDTTFLIVSDGITDEYYEGHVTDGDIEKILAQNRQPTAVAQQVVDKAAVFDDASVVIVKAYSTQLT